MLAADNMFRRWRTEVKRLLRPGENTLKVYFLSPIKVDLPKYDSLPYRYEAVNDQSANGGLFDKRVSVFARKAGYHYGWDWGPRLVTSGIWRPGLSGGLERRPHQRCLLPPAGGYGQAPPGSRSRWKSPPPVTWRKP